MAFFLNEQPPSPENPESSSHSPKSAPLFKQEGGSVALPGKSHVSLNDYLARHLTEQSTEPVPAPVPKKPVWIRPDKPVGPSEGTGQFLNSLDVDLASGLEQYLPTPIFRLRVMKKRLDGEIAELRGLLNKYSHLSNPSPDLKDRTNAVRRRLRVLEHHESRVSWQLSESMPMGRWFYQISAVGAALNQSITGFFSGFWRFMGRIFYGRSYLELEQAGEELQVLESMVRSRLSDSAAHSVEVGQLLNRFEQTLLKAESRAKKFSASSLLYRLWQESFGLLK